jgi:MoxR-like ATPase
VAVDRCPAALASELSWPRAIPPGILTMTVRPLSQANLSVTQRLAAVLVHLDRIVVGKPAPLKLALACLLARGHLLIEDIPGVGKSTLAQALAAVLGLQYTRVQFTSDLLPADVLGVSIYDIHAQAFRFHPGPIFSSVVLADEINRAPPKTQSALLEAMEERQVSQDGLTRPLPDPFFVIATQNPVEQIGAYPLPESQLDRFLMAIELGYPDAAAERDLLIGGDRRAQISVLGALADVPTLLEWQREAAQAHVSPALLDYVQALLAASRGNAGGGVDAGGRRGLSPRAGLLLMAAARAWALLSGRPMVLPEDVQAVFPAVAGHRLAGGARNGALHAQALLRSVALP